MAVKIAEADCWKLVTSKKGTLSWAIKKWIYTG